MSALSKHAAQIEAEFGSEVAAAWRRYHVAAQLARLGGGVATSVLWSAAHAGVGDWTDLVPVAAGALWATLAQMWPQVPWALLRNKLHPGQLPAKG